MFGILKNIKRLIFLVILTALAFIVVNILAFWQIGSFYVLKKYPQFEKVEQIAKIAEKIQGNEKKKEMKEEAMLLIIDKLKIEAPIIKSINEKEKDIQEDLKNGVVLFPNTAMPGDFGNTVLFGHSSDYFWRDGNFKTIFSLLNQLNAEDEIKIIENNKELIYKVTNKQIVSKNNKVILEQTENERRLTLITCWPIGTDLKRLAIEAELVE